MPEYTYMCECGRMKDLTHRMLYSTAVICTCGLSMWRVPPRGVAVNWNGPAPSGSPIHPNIQRLIDTAPQRREAFEKEHEDHERTSAQEI